VAGGKAKGKSPSYASGKIEKHPAGRFNEENRRKCRRGNSPDGKGAEKKSQRPEVEGCTYRGIGSQVGEENVTKNSHKTIKTRKSRVGARKEL